MNGDPIDALITGLGLPADYRDTVEKYWQPLATAIARRATHTSPLVVGINGAQGSGKSTLCAFLEVLLKKRGLRTVTLSIDDLYLKREERQALANEIHPLFATRGVPGTHAPGLGISIIESICAGRTFALPRFDKATDDRMDEAQPVSGPVDVLLFEGWCVGCTPQADEELLEPVNDLERNEDPEGVWRAVANLWLRGDYKKLFDQIDMLVMLKVDGFDAVIANRRKQEEKLRASRPDAPGVMDDAALARFCQHYERLTLHMLEDLPHRADMVFEIGPNQTPKGPAKGL
ncbi:P-loop NTPase fold protein [Alteraurantiacibacter aquimixticola]|uniref:Kinase n=1 Tax=Alteraurantiacibacter aquimixticola TaxID=2489173 RepID=A0A4V4U8V7_9SPHN|nr:P-loop NTPase fold protein [Alteraurantiacibacter aquimixticola]TIX51577.1 kinase [Alteraurantiacibacter aquimixticola]